jgi:hypothetical protein
MVDMDKIVSLSKRRGFMFQSSEIYGGTGSCWDYGPLGVELKKWCQAQLIDEVRHQPALHRCRAEPRRLVSVSCRVGKYLYLIRISGRARTV